MTSLNNLLLDPKDPREVLIELPEPKSVGDGCTLVMNGHHSYGGAEDPSPPKDSSAEDESDADVEESSTHLLQADKEDTPSVRCLKGGPRLPPFKPSPSKKSADAHSHVQHQPLGGGGGRPSKGRARLACLGLLLAALLLGAALAGLLLAAPGERRPPAARWWDGGVVYEIFPASFQDSDGDGFGDFRGIVQRLDYVQGLGVGVIRLNSVFSALDYPLEYEHVIDFATADPHLGGMGDFEELVREVHARGMRLVLDLNPCVTSDQHTWAAHWLLQVPGRYENYYVNVTDDKEDPPLESTPVYTDEEWPPPRRPFGSHFALNWSHALVQLEVRNAMDAWLSAGVDGFYVKHLADMRVDDPAHYLAALRQWRDVLDSHADNATARRALMLSQADARLLRAALGPARFRQAAAMVDLVDARLRPANGSEGVEGVRRFWAPLPAAPALVWHVGSAETLRLASGLGGARGLAALFLAAVLPGSFSCFYGDEIGLENAVHPDKNKVYRGGQFTPMQWTSGPQANFTLEDSDPWIPVHPGHVARNVLSERGKLGLFRALAAAKRGGRIYPPARGGRAASYRWHHSPCGLAVVAAAEGGREYAYVGNLGPEPLGFAGGGECGPAHPWGRLQVILSTSAAPGDTVDLQQLLLQPGDCVIGRLVT